MGKSVIQISVININYTTKCNSIQFNTIQYNARHRNNVNSVRRGNMYKITASNIKKYAILLNWIKK